jgi:hypothetical protein
MGKKTAELTGIALDWAVAKITNPEWWDDGYMDGDPMAALDMDDGAVYSPSTNWAQGGPIIEREKLVISPDPQHGWRAMPYMDLTEFYGPTPLVAAMRCYVASVLGDEVDIPEELT